VADWVRTLYKIGSFGKKPATKHAFWNEPPKCGHAMKIEVRVDADANERRRFLGGANIVPMIEVVSVMINRMMMVVVEERLKALTAEASENEPRKPS